MDPTTTTARAADAPTPIRALPPPTPPPLRRAPSPRPPLLPVLFLLAIAFALAFVVGAGARLGWNALPGVAADAARAIAPR